MATQTTDEPAWLRAYRGEAAPTATAQPGQQRRSQGGSGGSGTRNATSTTAPAAQRFNTGFSEPSPWAWDGGKRREPVLDMDRNPPMPVRHVGWRRCITCTNPFFSADLSGLRMCNRCKAVPE